MYSDTSNDKKGKDLKTDSKTPFQTLLDFDNNENNHDDVEGNTRESPLSFKEAARQTEHSFGKNLVWAREGSSMSATAGVDDEDKKFVDSNANTMSSSFSKLDATISGHFLLASLIDQHLQTFAMDASSRQAFRRSIFENIHRLGVMPKIFGSDDYSSLRLCFCPRRNLNSVGDYSSSSVGVVCRLSSVVCLSPILKMGFFPNALS